MAKRKKNRKAVLATSCIMAALIVASSTFAWFTSKDEVTNKLTATADYGVTLVEDFKPPKDMTPGQEVNKDVSVVNTGSVDAYVRMSLEEVMNMSRLNSVTYNTPAANYKKVYKKTNGTVVVKDASDAVLPDETLLYELKEFDAPLPNLETVTPQVVDQYVLLDPQEFQDATGAKKANEVTTLMAGGQVVVAESKAVAPDATAVRSGDDVNGATKFDIIYTLNVSDPASDPLDGVKVVYDSAASRYYDVEKNQDGLYVKKNPSTALDLTGKTYTVTVDTLARDYSGAEQYKPVENGLYIFKRNDTPKYSGFYYTKATITEPAKFYALETEDNNKSAYINGITVSDADTDGAVDTVTGVKLRTKETGIDNTKGEWKLEFIKVASSSQEPEAASGTISDTTNYSDATHLKATFHVDSDNDGSNPVTDKDVIFYIKLSDDWSNNWQFVKDNSTGSDTKDGSNDKGLGYFYYRTPLDSGETSAPLIDSVKLNKNMGSQNYLDMVYDLKVALETAQVTKDQYGKETAEAVVTGNDATTKWAVPTLKKNASTIEQLDTTGIYGDSVDGTIDWITWTAYTP